ncbi:solute carrier family 22 member 6-A-like isoform X2 [Ambystoma mexicanum]|uniref:solute carrier family 22 member 6-A-like isoform X2 n=1 Tax=Ambystoma mexicanum TaxID=8296 RepID=UPI0037E88093
MAFGDIVEEQGLGLFQILLVLLLSIPALLVPSHNFIQNFSAGVPEHRCRIWEVTNGSDTSNRMADLLRAFIPVDGDGKLQTCQRYAHPQWHLLKVNSTAANVSVMETEPCRDGWEYDQSVFTSTIITEWDLVCDRRSLKQFAQSIFMGGVLVGAFVYGGLADRFGRRTILLWSFLQIAGMGTGAAFSPNFIAYCVFRFLTGMGISGFILNDLSLCQEWIPARFRAMVVTLQAYLVTFGQPLLAGVAYVVREWRWLQLFSSLPFFIFFLYTWWLPESARWLIVNNKYESALKHLNRVTNFNKKQEKIQMMSLERLQKETQMDKPAVSTRHSIIDLFRSAAMCRITCCLTLVWFSTSFAFFAMAMDLQKFGLSIYLVQVIFGLIDVPFKLLAALSVTYVGRRFGQASCLILAGMLILASIAVPQDMQTVQITLSVLGKGSLASSILIAYVYSTELFPTVIRQTGMGFTQMMFRFGAMVSPLLMMAKDYVSFLPLVIFGVVALVAGVSVFLLPETLGVSLPDTIEQVQRRKLSSLDDF